MLHGKRQNPVVNGATGYRSAVPTTAPRPLAQLLVDSVRRFGCDPLTPGLGVTADAVAAAAALHRVTPAVAGHLAEIVGPSAGWAAKLAPARHAQLIRHLTAKSDLRTVASALEGVGAPWVTVKGPTLADRVWPRPDMREYYDLDVVVDRRGFGHALRALEDAGCVLVDRNWPLLRSTMRAELAMRGPLGTPIDLHWDIAVPKDLRRDFSTDVDRLLARSVPVELGGGVAARTLDPVDTLFHLAFHAAQAGANRLVWLGDLWFAASVPGLDGAELARRTEAAGASLPVALVLRRTEDVLGHLGHVPDSLRAAADTAWGRLVRARDGRTRFPGSRETLTSGARCTRAPAAASRRASSRRRGSVTPCGGMSDGTPRGRDRPTPCGSTSPMFAPDARTSARSRAVRRARPGSGIVVRRSATPRVDTLTEPWRPRSPTTTSRSLAGRNASSR